ncbi:hypothetical protein LOK49_LG14G01003 [Camellia lanceoleosa]|uniref:Uncharacterized protein n=1 Tax=Camellia lanceoleosa TaxID=1840588 RepID=A0ACC0FDT0_9ERIC|nr:hypothetical protein LOK49_LG14G01003 [Camellia lanceoleosa]
METLPSKVDGSSSGVQIFGLVLALKLSMTYSASWLRNCHFRALVSSSVGIVEAQRRSLDPLAEISYHNSAFEGPNFGSQGKIVLTSENSNSFNVGVRFDKPIPEGQDLGGQYEADHGFFYNASELQPESTTLKDLQKSINNILLEAIINESENSPFILFMKDIDKFLLENSEAHQVIKYLIHALPSNVVVIGSHTLRTKKEMVAMKCRDRLHELVKEEIEKKDSSTKEWKIAMESSFNRMDNESTGFVSNVPSLWHSCTLLSQKKRKDVITSSVCWTTMAALLVGLCFVIGPVQMLKLYGIPYWGFVMWLDLITYLHHHGHEEKLPWYRGKEWNYLRGGFTTLDRDYGWINNIHHDIGTHVIHHLFPQIPHHHLVEATEAAKPVLGKYYREPKKSGPLLFHLIGNLIRSMKQDHYVSDAGDAVYYQTDPKVSSSSKSE